MIKQYTNSDQAVIPSATAVEESNGNKWYMAAVWLSPDLRGQGAGRRLVRFGLDTVRVANTSSGRRGGVVMTSVRHGNDVALRLYQGLGFETSNPNEVVEKEGKSYTCTELRLRL